MEWIQVKGRCVVVSLTSPEVGRFHQHQHQASTCYRAEQFPSLFQSTCSFPSRYFRERFVKVRLVSCWTSGFARIEARSSLRRWPSPHPHKAKCWLQIYPPHLTIKFKEKSMANSGTTESSKEVKSSRKPECAPLFV